MVAFLNPQPKKVMLCFVVRHVNKSEGVTEHYGFLFDLSRAEEMLQILKKYAAAPELSFSWCEAVVLLQKIWWVVEQSQQAETE